MAKGNPNNYQWNSHTSTAHFHKINAKAEDQWNKWEYNPEKKDLKVDELHAKDDSESVKNQLIKFFEGKNISFLQNLYNRNSGNGNSGNWNSGDWNSGDRNSGDRNSGDRNSGNGNSGDRNSGDRNSGNWNSGDWNSGNWNSGNWNSGDRNSGNRNSGDRNSGNWNSGNGNSGNWNSGNWNSGNWNSGNGNSGNGNSGNGNSGNWNSGDRNSGNRNSGDRNSGNWNSGNGMKNSFCSKQKFFLFDKECKESDYRKSLEIDFYWFDLEKWINETDMTDDEKKSHLGYQTTGGFLKTFTYKEAWSKCPKEVLEKIKKLKNFNKKVFLEISGIQV
jgi:hypothetical protein